MIFDYLFGSVASGLGGCIREFTYLEKEKEELEKNQKNSRKRPHCIGHLTPSL